MLNRGLTGRSHGNRTARVLVVGTTPDYVDLLRCKHPGQCLFLTESALRLHAIEPSPDDDEEVLFRADKQLSSIELLRRFQDHHGIKIVGVVCFDCESMPLTALLAGQFGLPYPSREAIDRCRNKRRMKQYWTADGVPSARFSIINQAEQAGVFFRQIGGPCILKPLSGSGSELVFRVAHEADCRRLFHELVAELKTRRSAPLFRSCREGRTHLLMEEWIEGTEFSCDFVVERGRVCVLRVARKYPRRSGPAGTTEAYELSPDLPNTCRVPRLAPLLLQAASSLGIERAICMADFIVNGDRLVFLELTPRCGGDCLPALLEKACRFDILGFALRFARGSADRAVARITAPTVALRLFAEQSGTLESARTEALCADRRVLSVRLTRRIGTQVTLPPRNYDSWVLGHVIYRPTPGRDVATQNAELVALLQTRIVAK